jgi:hypothetical protein
MIQTSNYLQKKKGTLNWEQGTDKKQKLLSLELQSKKRCFLRCVARTRVRLAEKKNSAQASRSASGHYLNLMFKNHEFFLFPLKSSLFPLNNLLNSTSGWY